MHLALLLAFLATAAAVNVRVDYPPQDAKIRGAFHLTFSTFDPPHRGLFEIMIGEHPVAHVQASNHQGGKYVVAIDGLEPGSHSLRIHFKKDKESPSDFIVEHSIQSLSRNAGVPSRPNVAGTLQFSSYGVPWNVSATAVLVMDMWSYHACVPASMRVHLMVPKMNEVLNWLRNNGIQIVFVPSLGGPEYEGTPQRRRMRLADSHGPPVDMRFELSKWVSVERDPTSEPALPIVGPPAPSCDDIDPVEPPWDMERGYSQHSDLLMFPFDGLTDEPQEIYNFFMQEGITNVLIMGVHTNECVLKRAYGVRALLELGFNVAVVGDLTDAMYDSRNPPFVSRDRANQLVLEHINSFLCPVISSADLMKLVPGSNDL